jgi:hypothetical protein
LLTIKKNQEDSLKLENPAISAEEKNKIASKTLLQKIINSLLSLLFNFVYFIHPLNFDKTFGLFKEKAHFSLKIFTTILNFIFIIAQEFIQKKQSITKYRIKKILLEKSPILLFHFLFNYFLFSFGRLTYGNGLLIIISSFIDFVFELGFKNKIKNNLNI